MQHQRLVTASMMLFMMTCMVTNGIAVFADILAADQCPVEMAQHSFFWVYFGDTKHYLYVMPLKG